jgi:hypothetical protein
VPSTNAPYHAEHPKVLAIYCSDGRYTHAVEALAETLGHSRLDVLCVPGGPGAMSQWTMGSGILSGYLLNQAAFLIDRHGIRDVLLISHENCGFYREQLPRAGEPERYNRQCHDIQAAEHALKGRFPLLKVHMFAAHPEGACVGFTELHR